MGPRQFREHVRRVDDLAGAPDVMDLGGHRVVDGCTLLFTPFGFDVGALRPVPGGSVPRCRSSRVSVSRS